MTQFLPPNLLALFAARDPIPYVPPVAKLSHERPTSGYIGVGAFLHNFEDPADTPPPTKVETREERLERKRREKAEQVTYKLEQEIAVWNPIGNTAATAEPFKTLFVGRINYDTSESKLKREFESYGPIKKIHMVYNQKTGKPRGYAFVEYEHERDMRSAYKHADGKKIDGRRVLVDVERGRTVKGWLPRRLGGGLGGTRRGGPEVNVKISGREDQDRDRFRDKETDRPRERERDDRRDRRERTRSRDRDRERDKHREKDKDKDKDKDRERRRSRERDRDRDRDRKRRRSRSRDRKEIPEEGEEKTRKRSRSREKKRHRSKSKERDRKREKREKDRDKGDRGDRKDKIFKEELDANRVRIKEEPIDEGYAQYENNYGQDYDTYIKPERDPEGDEEGQIIRQNHDYDDGYDDNY